MSRGCCPPARGRGRGMRWRGKPRCRRRDLGTVGTQAGAVCAGRASRQRLRVAEGCGRCCMIQGCMLHLPCLHWKVISPCDLVLQQKASLPTSSPSRIPPPQAEKPLTPWLDRPCRRLQPPAHTPSPACPIVPQAPVPLGPTCQWALPGRDTGWHWECRCREQWRSHSLPQPP